MSPLVRSLLALAALLATAHAKLTTLRELPGSACAGFRIDHLTPLFPGDAIQILRFEMSSNGDGQLHEIPDRCWSQLRREIFSQTVRVCNVVKHTKLPVTMTPRPKVFSLSDHRLSPVFAACNPWDEMNHDCGPLTFHITQECIPVRLL